MGMIGCPLCRKCGAEDETSIHILCECEDLATRGRTYLGSFCLDLEDVRTLSVCGGEHLECIKRAGPPRLRHQSKEYKGPFKGLRALGPKGLEPIMSSILFF
jgi:hypothetical protein